MSNYVNLKPNQKYLKIGLKRFKALFENLYLHFVRVIGKTKKIIQMFFRNLYFFNCRNSYISLQKHVTGKFTGFIKKYFILLITIRRSVLFYRTVEFTLSNTVRM